MLLERVNMTEAADKRVKEYSRGMRQRLGIADVLMKQPRVIILDEPTLGIDPEGVHELLALIRELAENDRLTVLISSHMLNQVEQICHRVGIFVKGKLAACGDIATLREETQVQENVMLEFNAKPDDVELDALIRSVPGVNEVKKERGLYIIRAGSDVRNGLASTVLEKGYSLLHIRQLGYDLDNIYSNYFVKEAMQ
jgi:ABC-2 type transport system ATP-binding protein